MDDRFYVYTLAYPESMGGDVFYVGKGQNYGKSRGDRVDDHEKQAQGLKIYNNSRKIAIIKEIWTNGEDVVKHKVAFFDNELDAYMYEWALLNMMCYSERLTNAQQKAPSTWDGASVLCRRSPNLPHTYACSTIGPTRLNFRVRDGNGCDPRSKLTGKLSKSR